MSLQSPCYCCGMVTRHELRGVPLCDDCRPARVEPEPTPEPAPEPAKAHWLGSWPSGAPACWGGHFDLAAECAQCVHAGACARAKAQS
jgi:hypothetical protein